MRISAKPDSPYWRPDAWRVQVYLDGKQLFDCVEADSNANWVKVLVPTPFGWDERLRYGNVCILIPEED